MKLFYHLADEMTNLISDVEVRDTSEPITPGEASPFDNHLYASFIIRDSEISLTKEAISETYFLPAVKSLARVLNGFQIVECKSLYIDLETCGARQQEVRVGKIPVRFTESYDIQSQGTKVIADMLVRHVGNYYKTIINGPLHRHQMPFKRVPEGVFDYTYIQQSRMYYAHEVDTGQLDYYGDSIFESQALPGLDTSQMHLDHVHSYRVDGDYCYYTGEHLKAIE